jgi:DNA polymerase-3 subunit gamma/tau
MGYEVLARKWRPQQFEDVVGQKHVTDTLSNAISSDRLAHAYLFVGPRGIGKTSIARIFAKALNCEKGPTVTPCGKCDSCLEIAGGTNLDVLEIDGASNNGVEQVRDLRDSVMYAPARGKFKIYIIDEVHMLSNAAFNALLKTLEEPPPHVKFFFATTEPDKILTTIISRCQRFDLKRIPVAEIVERLEVIAKAEKVKISDDALIAVARGAEGGLRDAESALDQLIAFRGNKIEEEDVLSVFGLVSRAGLEKLAEGVLKGDLKTIIQLAGEFDNAGKDLGRLVAELVEHFRNLLIALNVDDLGEVMEVTAGQKKVIKAQAEMTDTARLLRVMGVLTQAADRLKFALSQKTLLETALIKAGRVATVVSIEEVLREIKAMKGGAAVEGKKKDERPIAQVEEIPSEVPQKTASSTKPSKPTPEKPAPEQSSPDLTVAAIADKWDAIVEKVGQISVAARGSLSDAHPVRIEGDTVVIGFEPDFAHEIDRFKNLRNRKAVEKALEREVGQKIEVKFEVSSDIEYSSEEKLPAAAKEAPSAEKPSGMNKKSELISDPAVQKAMEMFDGNIMEVRE